MPIIYLEWFSDCRIVQVVDHEVDPTRRNILFHLDFGFASVDQAIEFTQPVACLWCTGHSQTLKAAAAAFWNLWKQKWESCNLAPKILDFLHFSYSKMAVQTEHSLKYWDSFSITYSAVAVLIGFLPTSAPVDKAVHEAEQCRMGQLHLSVIKVSKDNDWLVNHGNHISTNHKVERSFLNGRWCHFLYIYYIYYIYFCVVVGFKCYALFNVCKLLLMNSVIASWIY